MEVSGVWRAGMWRRRFWHERFWLGGAVAAVFVAVGNALRRARQELASSPAQGSALSVAAGGAVKDAEAETRRIKQ